MTLDIRADTLSCTLRVAADETWESAESVAAENGLTLEYLVDIRPGKSVGETLAAPAWLPPLWPPHTARAACIALSGVGPDGAAYASVVAPRTASGPDLRSFFLEASGALGRITAVTLRCEPAGAARWLRPTTSSRALELHSVVNRFGSVVSVHGDAAGPIVRVRLGSRLAMRATDALEELGFVEDTRPERVWEPRVVATLPWDCLEEAMRPDGGRAPRFLAAGPTHVAVALRALSPDDVSAATDWARVRVASAPSIGRFVRDLGQTWPKATPSVGEVVR